MELRPNKSEELFLNLAYNRFYDLFDEIMNDDFWQKDEGYRFSKVSNIFAVYAELLAYEPIRFVLEEGKTRRPPVESKIGGAMFRLVRNILAHFPLFEAWDDVWVSKDLVNWQNKGQAIDLFFEKYAGHKEVRYRFWEAKKKLMTYLSICFPEEYGDKKIYLKDMIPEKDGVKFSIIMMWQILNTQVESIG